MTRTGLPGKLAPMLWKVTALLTGLALVPDASAEPFLTRDQNLLLAGSGLPSAMPARFVTVHAPRLELTLNWSNTANSELTADEALLVDLESRELRLIVEHSLSERFSLRLQVPYRQLGAGVLDSFIDSWHDALGLPEGARTFLPDDQFSIAYLREGGRALELRQPHRGFGDVSLEAGYQWWKSFGSAGALWLSVESPTGSSRYLQGNGAWDFSLTQAGMRRVSQRVTLFWQASVSHVGTGRYLRNIQKDWILGAVGALAYDITPALAIKGQVDAHSASYASGLDFLGSATILTVGGDYDFGNGWRLDLGISEDIDVSASPDVSFNIALRKLL